eukprot:TRINITY_DN973_c0_g2_i1.p1 TRINITY_DN973_c0_g2~~TRINITY_DN973_c0_g2_i1.p1  ORF type:complete len:1809 (+),score=239.90 TRINITY_DN973_c0_g2_i1:84-5510(+)
MGSLNRRVLAILTFQLMFGHTGARRICYSFFGGVNDFGFTYMQNVARSYVDDELSSVSDYREGVFFLDADAKESVFRDFAGNCDVIVVGSDTMHDITLRFAKEHPSVTFVIVGHIPRPSVTNYAFAYARTYQGKYVAGLIAASHPGVKRLGYVGSVRSSIAFPNANAFYLGAASVNPDIIVININTDSWFSPELERVAGLQLFELHGVDLIGFDSDSDELCKLAVEQGKLSVGYKSNAAIVHGNSVLTSVVFDWRKSFKRLVSAALDGGEAWNSAYEAFEYVGFDENAISMGTYSTAVSAQTRAKARAAIDAFAAKKDTVFCSSAGGFNDTQGIWRYPKLGGNCLRMESTDSDLQDMNWLHGGITDLGYVKVKSAIHVCFAFGGRISDMGWTYHQNQARNHVDARIDGCTSEFIENVALIDESRRKITLDTFVAKGCDIVVLGSSMLSQLANDYAGRHPDINWIGADLQYNEGHTNLATARIRAYQGKFIAGMIAGLQPGVTRLGYVMALRTSESMRDANAFYLGAKLVNPAINMTALTVGSSHAPREERIAGQRLYHIYGADVIAYDSDSDELCKLAAELDKLSIGHKSDCTASWGDSNLASTVLDWRESFALLTEATKNNLWSAFWQTTEFQGFEGKALTMGTYSAKVGLETRAKVETQLAVFAAGDDKIFCEKFTDTNGNTHMPEGADGCFTDAQLLNDLAWLHDGIDDLGTLSVPPSCPRGQRLDALAARLCVDCNAGTYTACEDMTECRECQSGLFASTQGATACQICPPGSFSNREGSASCDACPDGTYSTGGSTICADCPAGKYRSGGSAALLSSCLSCDIASYSAQSGSSRCMPCREYHTTRYPSATSKAECLCSAGFYRQASVCHRCGEGLSCDIGTTVPEQVAGFWVETKGNASAFVDFSVFKCRNAHECPEGPPGTCASGRTGKACANCKDMHFRGEQGECSPCGHVGMLPVLLTVLAATCAMVVLYIFSAVDPSKQMLTMVTIIACMGQLVMFVQALGAFKNMEIILVEPVKGFLDVLSVMTFDLDVVRASCVLTVDSPSLKYLGRLLVHPFLVLSLTFMLGIAKLAGRQVDLDRMINSQGAFILVFYLSLTINSLLPFQCVPNPNGTSAMSANPSVICWVSEGDHTLMVLMGVIGVLCYPVAVSVTVAWATLQFPRRIAAADGVRFVKRYKWLFNRFKHKAYYYGGAYLTRNLCIALTPTIFAFSARAQILVMTSVLVLTALIQVRVWPWRTKFANLADMTINAVLILTMPGMCLLIPESDRSQKEYVASYLISIMVLAFLSGLLTITYMVYRQFAPAKPYIAFLCHHKGGAANLARLFKIKLCQLTTSDIFLDSDALETLDLLYDTVRSRVKNLVILLTKETLSRMWCCGEITTAVKNNVPIIPVPCDDYVPPTNEDFEIIEKGWSAEEWAMLATMGVMPEDMKSAYTLVMSLPHISFRRFSLIPEQLSTINNVARACGLTVTCYVSSETVANTSILLVCAVTDAEALCGSEILREQLQKTTQVQCLVSSCSDEAGKYSASAEYVCVVLTKGLFRDSGFAKSLLAFARVGRYPGNEAGDDPVEVVTILADQNFDFLNADERLEAAKFALRESGQASDDIQMLVDCYEYTLKVLAINIDFRASWKVCSVQIEVLRHRFKKYRGSYTDQDVGLTRQSLSSKKRQNLQSKSDFSDDHSSAKDTDSNAHPSTEVASYCGRPTSPMNALQKDQVQADESDDSFNIGDSHEGQRYLCSSSGASVHGSGGFDSLCDSASSLASSEGLAAGHQSQRRLARGPLLPSMSKLVLSGSLNMPSPF